MQTNSRRNFIRLFSGAATTLPFLYAVNPTFGRSAEEMKKTLDTAPPSAFAQDEDFWGWIREAYTVSANIINLNNGGVAPLFQVSDHLLPEDMTKVITKHFVCYPKDIE